MFTAGDKIQSGPGHRHTMVAGPVTGTVEYVRPGGGLLDVVWDTVTFHGEDKHLPPSVEVAEDLEPAKAAPTRRRTTAATRDPGHEAEIRMDARLARLHQERATGAHRDLKRWATVYKQRDEFIRAAHAAGIGVNEIAREMGIAKTTVLRVLHPEGDQ